RRTPILAAAAIITLSSVRLVRAEPTQPVRKCLLSSWSHERAPGQRLARRPGDATDANGHLAGRGVNPRRGRARSATTRCAGKRLPRLPAAGGLARDGRAREAPCLRP